MARFYRVRMHARLAKPGTYSRRHKDLAEKRGMLSLSFRVRTSPRSANERSKLLQW